MHKYSFGNSSKSLTFFQGKSSVTPKRITYGCTQLLNANEFLEQVHSSSIPLLQIYVSFFFIQFYVGGRCKLCLVIYFSCRSWEEKCRESSWNPKLKEFIVDLLKYSFFSKYNLAMIVVVLFLTYI